MEKPKCAQIVLVDLPKCGRIIDLRFCLSSALARLRLRAVPGASACFFGSCYPFFIDRATAGTRRGESTHHA
jgi:hypothetical protein